MRELRPGQVDSVGRQEHRKLYDSYMHSPAWYQRRFRWFETELQLIPAGQKVRCIGGCGKLWVLSRDDLHHVTYERLGAEEHEDLWPMCRSCHTALHDLIASTPSWRKLPREQANQYALGILLDVAAGVAAEPAPKGATAALSDYL